MKNKLFILLLAVILFCFPCFSQETTGELTGKVLLSDGTVLPGVIISIQSSSLIGKKNIISDENGQYRVPMLPPGKYSLTFKLEGFKTGVIKGVDLQVGKVLKVDLVMETGAIEESLEITGSAPIIDVKQSATVANINKETFAKLPKGRNFSSLMNTQAGVNYEKGGVIRKTDREGDGYFFNGGTLSENTFFVDGINTTGVTGGMNNQRVDVDCVEELQLKAAGYAAEYGGSMGGVISVITKSGSNEFHGDLSFYYAADWLNAKEKAPLALDPHDTSVAYYDEGVLKDKFSVIEPSVSLGGFLKKDKIWYFLNFSPSFTKTERTGRFVYAPEHNGEKFDSETTRYKGTGKLTFSLSNAIRLTLGGTIDWQKTLRLLPDHLGTGNYNPNSWDIYGYKWPRMTLSGGLDWSISNDKFLTLTGGYFRANAMEDGSETLTPSTRVEFENSNAQLNPRADLVRAKGFENITKSELLVEKEYLQEKIQVNGDFTYYFTVAGDHVAKAGINWTRQKLSVDKSFGNENWSFFWRDDAKGLYTQHVSRYDGVVSPVTYGYVESWLKGKKGKIHNDVISLYVQDSWTIKNNFTLNYGIRMEKEKMPTFFKDYKTAFEFDFFDKIAPRVGFAWDINGDGKNKVFGAFGIYYDIMKMDMALSTFGSAVEYTAFYDLVTLDWTQYLNAKGAIWQGGDPIANTDPILGGKRFIAMNHAPAADPNTMVQPDIKPVSKMELSLGYSRMLSADVSFSVTGVYNTVLNTIEDIGIQTPTAEVYYVGNPGSDWVREQFDPANNPNLPHDYKAPKAQRKYRALKFELDKKLSKNWFGGASITFSKLTGNYSGLASTDEDNRITAMATRLFDSWFLHLKQDLSECVGVLPTDRPVDLRIFGAYSFNSGLTFGFNSFIKSGTPITRMIPVNWYWGYAPEGRGTLGRTSTIWQIDMYAEKSFKLGDKVKFAVSANIVNVTNNKIAYRKWNRENYTQVGVSNEDLKLGYNIDDVMTNLGTVKDPRYLKEMGFQAPLNAQLGFKLTF